MIDYSQDISILLSELFNIEIAIDASNGSIDRVSFKA